MKAIRLALFADPSQARAAFEEIALGVHRATAMMLEPLFVSSYAGLSQALDSGACDLAWSPPVVAQGLIESGVGRPLVAVGRGGRTTYYSVLVMRGAPGDVRLRDLAGARVGWVSKLSAAGYVVPTLYLKSLGLDPSSLFAHESFCGSHDAVLRALTAGEIDVGATHSTLPTESRSLTLPPGAPSGARIVLAAGPIPGDVIFASGGLGPIFRRALRQAFLSMPIAWNGPLARLMNVDSFEVPKLDHFEQLRAWRARAVESERTPRLPLALRDPKSPSEASPG